MNKFTDVAKGLDIDKLLNEGKGWLKKQGFVAVSNLYVFARRPGADMTAYKDGNSWAFHIKTKPGRNRRIQTSLLPRQCGYVTAFLIKDLHDNGGWYIVPIEDDSAKECRWRRNPEVLQIFHDISEDSVEREREFDPLFMRTKEKRAEIESL